MKKSIFLFGLLFVTSLMCAQKTVWVKQTGGHNKATIKQNACQSLDALYIYAWQPGYMNSLTTFQKSPDNYLKLIQGGDENSADLTQRNCECDPEENDMYITQSGNSNEATTFQKGNDNYLYLYQDGYDNDADFIQKNCCDTYPGWNDVDIYQWGNSDTVSGYQLGHINWAGLSQPGIFNYSFVIQEICEHNHNPTPYYNGNNVLDVDQSGIKNSAEVIQREDNQSGMDWSWNYAKARQSGYKNNYSLKQGRFGSGVWKPVNKSYLTQSGNSNYASMSQSGLKQYSEITQTSGAKFNLAKLDQRGAHFNGWNKSYSRQYGYKNDIIIHQHANAALTYANSIQNGTKNYTLIEQASTEETKAKAYQYGSTDELDIDQHD